MPWSWQDSPSFQGEGERPGVGLLGTIPVATQVPLLVRLLRREGAGYDGNMGLGALSLRTAYLLPLLLGLMFLPKQHNVGRNEMTPLEASLPPHVLHTPGLGDLT